MKAASRWNELGFDSREMAALKFGIFGPPNRKVEPFTLRKIRLNQEDSDVMMDVIKKRIEVRIWEEIQAHQIRNEKYISREFIAWDSDRKSRSVADL